MKNIGITIICIRPMNDCICLMRAATITPNAGRSRHSGFPLFTLHFP
jgi:hypothetical protein